MNEWIERKVIVFERRFRFAVSSAIIYRSQMYNNNNKKKIKRKVHIIITISAKQNLKQ